MDWYSFLIGFIVGSILFFLWFVLIGAIMGANHALKQAQTRRIKGNNDDPLSALVHKAIHLPSGEFITFTLTHDVTMPDDDGGEGSREIFPKQEFWRNN